MRFDATSQVSSDITKKLSKLSIAQSGSTIYRVHQHLREVNDKAYEPEIIAIGPYHRDKDHLKMLEEHKLRYLNLLLQRNNENVKRYVSAIGQLEDEARKCYAEHVALNSSKFIELMVLDGSFIIELVRKFSMRELREKNDPIFNMNWMVNSLQRDLMLFENQIPFFILCKLFDLIDRPDNHNRLVGLVFSFFENLYPGNVGNVIRESSSRSPDKIKHLLDFIHNKWLPNSHDFLIKLEEDTGYTIKTLQFINNTTGLRDANVKFKVKFKRNEGMTLFDVSFENGTLLLPRLMVEDRTESFLRNLIAYEQYFHDFQSSFVTDYVKFMDCLINSSRDVEILSSRGIINNWLGDDEVVANMFNKLMDSVTGPDKRFVYAEMFVNVNVHCNKRRNKWMAKLRRNYLNSPWGVISILVAVVLLLLTVTQTVFTILQVVLNTKGTH